MFHKIGAPKYFANFTGKNLCCSLKGAGFWLTHFIKNVREMLQAISESETQKGHISKNLEIYQKIRCSHRRCYCEEMKRIGSIKNICYYIPDPIRKSFKYKIVNLFNRNTPKQIVYGREKKLSQPKPQKQFEEN